MNNETILAYVAGERARGVTDDAIRDALLAQGWRAEDVASAMTGGATTTSATRTLTLGNLYQGRLGRWQYFLTSLLLGLSLLVFLLLLGITLGVIGLFTRESLVTIVVVVTYVLCIPISLSPSVRRAHDINWSGWTILLLFIPFVNFVVMLLFFFKKGTEGPNTYGLPQPDRNFKNTLLNL